MLALPLRSRIREAAYMLAPRIFPRPPWVSRWAPTCTCGGMSMREFVAELRLSASGNADVRLCSDSARRLADFLEPRVTYSPTIVGQTSSSSNVGVSISYIPPLVDRGFPPLSGC
jgi:hypothetical protein